MKIGGNKGYNGQVFRGSTPSERLVPPAFETQYVRGQKLSLLPSTNRVNSLFEFQHQKNIPDDIRDLLSLSSSSQRLEEYGAQRMVEITLGQSVTYFMTDGSSLFLRLIDHPFDLDRRPDERVVASLWKRVSGESEYECIVGYYESSPTIGEIRKNLESEGYTVERCENEIEYDLSPYQSWYYRYDNWFAPIDPISAVRFKWNCEEGSIGSIPTFLGKLSPGHLLEFPSLKSLRTHFGGVLSGQAQDGINSLCKQGIKFSRELLSDHLKKHFSDWSLETFSKGDDAKVYHLSSPDSKKSYTVFHFSNRQMETYNYDPSQVRMDFVLSSVRCETLLRKLDVQEMRMARLYAIGSDWVIQEHLPNENFNLPKSEYWRVEKWMNYFDLYWQDTGDPEALMLKHLLSRNCGEVFEMFEGTTFNLARVIENGTMKLVIQRLVC